MITFRTTTVRNCEVDAWDVTVEAFFDMSDEIRYVERGETLTDLLQDLPGETEHGFRIAELKGILVKGITFCEPEDVQHFMPQLAEIGSTFDIYEGTYSTSRNFLGWLEHGGHEELFDSFDDPIRGIFVSENLVADPHVDRGAMLALMTEQLDQFSYYRLLCVHEEPIDAVLPEDQRGLMPERISSLTAFCEAKEIELIAANSGAEARGKGLRIAKNLLGEPLPLPGQLPLFILATSAYGHPEVMPYLSDDEEVMVIDIADWCQAKFGITLATEAYMEPEPF